MDLRSIEFLHSAVAVSVRPNVNDSLPSNPKRLKMIQIEVTGLLPKVFPRQLGLNSSLIQPPHGRGIGRPSAAASLGSQVAVG